MRTHFFKNLIDTNRDNLFIGTGNPYSDILIIGKEAAIDKQTHQEQFKREIANNQEDWCRNLQEGTTADQIESWFDAKPTYNPLYPYKKQLFKVRNSKNENNGGTSKTCYNYQKLIDLVNQKERSEFIDFHEHTFSTELNEATGNYSHLIDKRERIKSLESRLKFLRHDFYQSFPIVIVACGHYVRDFNINLCDLFNVEFDAQTGTIPITKSNYINLHYSKDPNKQKLVIHTNQLSMNISNLLLTEIAKYIHEFINLTPSASAVNHLD